MEYFNFVKDKMNISDIMSVISCLLITSFVGGNGGVKIPVHIRLTMGVGLLIATNSERNDVGYQGYARMVWAANKHKDK